MHKIAFITVSLFCTIVIFIIFLTLTGCLFDSKDKFPVTKTLDFSLQNTQFSERSIKVTSDNRLQFEYIADVPLEAHDGAICIDASEFIPLKRWVERHLVSDKSL